MKIRFASLCQLMALTLVTCFCLSALAVAQDTPTTDENVRARFVVLPKPIDPNMRTPTPTLQEWNGMFVYNGHTYPYVMVGADPATNQSATITAYVIPVKIVLSTGERFDPLGSPSGPFSPYARTLTSPIFDSTTTYNQMGTDVGTTQYIDAFQRANFWSIVTANPNSHLLLTTPIGVSSAFPELVLNVPAASGHLGHPFNGHAAAEVDFGYFDGQITAYIAAHSQIDPSKFPIFETTDTYLTSGGCCIGGYHSNAGAQTYAHFTYVDHPGDFSQDVSALSHEVGEWADDPLYPSRNITPCGILEVGDPLENHPNYGSTPYLLHGFMYNLQDLAFLRYFGGDPNGSVNSWWTFQGYPYTMICQEGS